MLEPKQVNFLPFSYELHVSVSGSDTEGNGSVEKPYATLEKARDIAVAYTTIVVHPGIYLVTTTDINGLAKTSIGYYFMEGAIIIKATSGDMFNTKGLTGAFFIFGYGIFRKTVTSGYIFNINYPRDFYCQCLQIESYTGTAILISLAQLVYIEARKLKVETTLGINQDCIEITGTILSSRINIVTIVNDTNLGLPCYIHDLTSDGLKITSEKIQNDVAGVSSVIENVVLGANSYIDIDVVYLEKCTITNVTNIRLKATSSEITGDTIENLEFIGNIKKTVTLTDCTKTQFTGIFSSFILNGLGNYNINGLIELLSVLTGTQEVYCDNVNLFQINSPNSNTYINKLNYSSNASEENILKDGNVILNAGSKINRIVIEAGELHYKGDLVTDNNFTVGGCIILKGGILHIYGRISNTLTGDASNCCIEWNGGDIILNGVTLLCAEPTTFPIICNITGGEDICILTGGYNTNISGTLSARAHSVKFTVTADAIITWITVNDGVTSSTFTSNQPTKTLIAAELTVLINLDGALALTATHVPGNDYFEVTADVAGNAFTSSGLVNLTGSTITYNSTLMTPNPAAGVGFIIEDVAVK